MRRLVPALLLITATATAAVATAARPLLRAQEAPPMPEPTKEHRELMQTVGVWEGTLTSYVPGVPAEPTPAREVIEAVGEFWTAVRFECDFMGTPYTGTGHVGYDPAMGKYRGTWVDSMSPMLAVMEGELDAEKGALVMHWMAPDWSGNMVPHRSEMVRTRDSYTSNFFMGEGDAEMRSMTIEMHRSEGGDHDGPGHDDGRGEHDEGREHQDSDHE